MHIDLTEVWLYFVFNKLFGTKGSIESDVLNKYFIFQFVTTWDTRELNQMVDGI